METKTKAWKINEAGIIKSMDQVLKIGNIEKLTKDCYNFTMNVSGFIAHYNLYGFMDQYRNTADLIQDLKNSSDIARPEYYMEEFFQRDQKEYYSAKSRILKAFGEMVKKYEDAGADRENELITNKWEALQGLVNKERTTAEKKMYLSKLGIL